MDLKFLINEIKVIMDLVSNLVVIVWSKIIKKQIDRKNFINNIDCSDYKITFKLREAIDNFRVFYVEINELRTIINHKEFNAKHAINLETAAVILVEKKGLALIENSHFVKKILPDTKVIKSIKKGLVPIISIYAQLLKKMLFHISEVDNALKKAPSKPLSIIKEDYVLVLTSLSISNLNRLADFINIGWGIKTDFEKKG